MLNDILSSGLSKILNAERTGKKECIIRPSSKVVVNVLKLMNHNNYIGSFDVVNNTKGGHIKINLLGRLNKCGSIKPRYSIKKTGFEKFEKRYLLAKDFGIIIVSTQEGLMTHYDAKKKGIGGRLIAYAY